MPTPSELLAKFNPALVLLPQDFRRPRPYRPWFSRTKVPRGDYHPSSAEFFLSHTFVRDKPKSWWIRSDVPQRPLGLANLREMVKSGHGSANQDTVNWELDIGPIRSQRPGRAWPSYRGMVEAFAKPFQPTVYARSVNYPDRLALQYWYLYVYNDAGNYHEGDWEMVTFELDAQGKPLNAGYSGHASGFRRSWEGVQTVGTRPLVYVARGSHAAYFEHKKNGHRTRSLRSPKGLPPLVEAVIRQIQSLIIDAIVFLRWNDFTPTHPDQPDDVAWNQGVLVRPHLEILPALTDVTSSSPFWWMWVRCRWGSSHSRLRGTKAPRPPWEREPEWSDPLKWLHALE